VLSSAEHGTEAGLLEMVVAGEGISQAELGHHDEGDAVGQGPELVGSMGEQVRTRLEQRSASRYDFRVGVGFEEREKPGEALTVGRTAECIADLGKDHSVVTKRPRRDSEAAIRGTSWSGLRFEASVGGRDTWMP
jgi:hypothetical protein